MVFGRGAHWGFQLPVVFYFRKKRGKLGEILRCDEAVESTWVLLYIYVYFSVHLKYFERNKGRGKRKRKIGTPLAVECWTDWWRGITQS